MKRIVMLLKSRIYAGAEKIAITIMQNLKEEYEFYYVSPYGEIAQRLEAESLSYIPLSDFQIKEIRSIVRNLRPDLIHAHDFSASAAASLLKDWHGKPKVISHLHYNARENQRWGKKAMIYRVALNRIDQVVCVSDAVVKEAVFKRALEGKTKVLGNPIDAVRIQTMAVAERGEDWIEKAEKKEEVYLYDIVFVGRFTKQKDPEKLIRIIARLKKSGQLVKAAFIGTGELEESCDRLILQYGLEEQVHRLGYLENPYPIIKRSRLLCMTSKEEGFGLAVAEAMVLGVPVLVSKVGGMKTLLGADAEEFCETEQEYVEKIKRLLQDPIFYQAAKKRSRRRADCFCEVESYMEEMRKLYRELILR